MSRYPISTKGKGLAKPGKIYVSSSLKLLKVRDFVLKYMTYIFSVKVAINFIECNLRYVGFYGNRWAGLL